MLRNQSSSKKSSTYSPWKKNYEESSPPCRRHHALGSIENPPSNPTISNDSRCFDLTENDTMIIKDNGKEYDLTNSFNTNDISSISLLSIQKKNESNERDSFVYLQQDHGDEKRNDRDESFCQVVKNDEITTSRLDFDEGRDIQNDDVISVHSFHIDDANISESRNLFILDKPTPLRTSGRKMDATNEERSISESSSFNSSSSPQPSPLASCIGANNNQETEEERRRREEEESEALARQLMAEEALASYQQSTEFLMTHANEYSEEDLAALRSIMAEEGGETTANIYNEEEEDEDDEGEDIDISELSYEALLRLGEHIGDVKTERWSLRAKNEISKLSTKKFSSCMAEGKDENDSGVKCLVCQCQFEVGEEIRTLPCRHYFHNVCVDQWLMQKDFCPYCRQCIIIDQDSM